MTHRVTSFVCILIWQRFHLYGISSDNAGLEKRKYYHKGKERLV